MRIATVGEVARYLKVLLEEDYNLQDIWVRGEVTNYTQSSAGHRYFSLKDETATLRCVLFNGRGGAYTPPLRNGMEALAHGRFSMYEARGDLQFYVDAVEDAGIGVLHLRFEALKARLEAEGLFDAERKRALPAHPSVIGVVTSPQAAALRDILRTLRLRCPLLRVILAPTLVQGDGAAEQVAAAIRALSDHGEAEVIIVARGGGSLEELWAFNEAEVAYAIVASRVPVVTGIGHETDFTIADFVADLRASTPTAAATLVAPDASVWRDSLDATRARLDELMEGELAIRADRLSQFRQRLERESPARRVEQTRQRLDEMERALALRLRHTLSLRREQVRAAAMQLHALSPLLTLARGFAVVRAEPGGRVVTSASEVSTGQELTIRVADGAFAAIAGARLSASADGGVAQETPDPPLSTTRSPSSAHRFSERTATEEHMSKEGKEGEAPNGK
jgi:exodeoxyribonuclease VII large subunit